MHQLYSAPLIQSGPAYYRMLARTERHLYDPRKPSRHRRGIPMTPAPNLVGD